MADASHNSVLSLVVFSIEGQRYAIRLPVVERVLPIVEISPLPKAPAVTLGVVNLHGRIIPILDIRRRFGLPPRDYGPAAHLLVARTSRRTLALPVGLVPITLTIALCFIRRIFLFMCSCIGRYDHA